MAGRDVRAGALGTADCARGVSEIEPGLKISSSRRTKAIAPRIAEGWPAFSELAAFPRVVRYLSNRAQARSIGRRAASRAAGGAANVLNLLPLSAASWTLPDLLLARPGRDRA